LLAYLNSTHVNSSWVSAQVNSHWVSAQLNSCWVPSGNKQRLGLTGEIRGGNEQKPKEEENKFNQPISTRKFKGQLSSPQLNFRFFFYQVTKKFYQKFVLSICIFIKEMIFEHLFCNNYFNSLYLKIKKTFDNPLYIRVFS